MHCQEHFEGEREISATCLYKVVKIGFTERVYNDQSSIKERSVEFLFEMLYYLTRRVYLQKDCIITMLQTLLNNSYKCTDSQQIS